MSGEAAFTADTDRRDTAARRTRSKPFRYMRLRSTRGKGDVLVGTGGELGAKVSVREAIHYWREHVTKPRSTSE